MGHEYIVALAEHSSDVNVMIKKLDDFMTKSKFRSYKKKSYSRQRLEEFQAEEIWRYRLEEIEKISVLMEEVK